MRHLFVHKRHSLYPLLYSTPILVPIAPIIFIDDQRDVRKTAWVQIQLGEAQTIVGGARGIELVMLKAVALGSAVYGRQYRKRIPDKAQSAMDIELGLSSLIASMKDFPLSPYAFFLLSIIVALCLATTRRRYRLPPGPAGLPFIGNLLDVPKNNQWLGYQEWSRKYGESNVFFIRVSSMYFRRI